MSKSKNQKSQNIKYSSSQKQLSENEVKETLNFAQEIYNNFNKGLWNTINVFTPETVNQRLQQVTTNPLEAKKEEINTALLNPINHEEQLIGYNQFFEMTDMLVKRTMYYLSTILSFDYTFTCKNAYTNNDYHTKEYEEDYRIVKDFFNKFDVKQQFSYIMKQLLRQEAGFYIFRTDGIKYQFQDLPYKYCKITGKWDYGMLFDFNMNWFLQPAVDINMYPPVFKKMYKEIFKGSEDYYPSNPLNKRNGAWAYWVQTSPLDNFWCFKMNPDTASNIPYLTAMFPDAVLRPLYRQLQTNQAIISAQKVMVGLIPFLKDPKSGAVQDQFAISAEQMGNFLGLLKKGLSDVLKVGAVPFEDVKVLDFKPNDKDMFQQYNHTTSGAMGVTSRLIYADDKMTANELLSSQEIDCNIVKYVYKFFDDFLNYEINKRTKTYKFKFTLEGTNFTNDRRERFDTAMKLADKGILLDQKIASAMGMSIFDFHDMLAMSKESGFTDNLQMLLNVNTGLFGNQPSDKKVGRPSASLDTMGESTERKLDVVLKE